MLEVIFDGKPIAPDCVLKALEEYINERIDEQLEKALAKISPNEIKVPKRPCCMIDEWAGA